MSVCKSRGGGETSAVWTRGSTPFPVMRVQIYGAAGHRRGLPGGTAPKLQRVVRNLVAQAVSGSQVNSTFVLTPGGETDRRTDSWTDSRAVCVCVWGGGGGGRGGAYIQKDWQTSELELVKTVNSSRSLAAGTDPPPPPHRSTVCLEANLTPPPPPALALPSRGHPNDL